jgi:hypothetical protein
VYTKNLLGQRSTKLAAGQFGFHGLTSISTPTGCFNHGLWIQINIKNIAICVIFWCNIFGLPLFFTNKPVFRCLSPRSQRLIQKITLEFQSTYVRESQTPITSTGCRNDPFVYMIIHRLHWMLSHCNISHYSTSMRLTPPTMELHILKAWHQSFYFYFIKLLSMGVKIVSKGAEK